MSLTGLSSRDLLTQTLQFITTTLTDCGFAAAQTFPWHHEPVRMMSTDCDNENATTKYTVVGWIMQNFEADAYLNPVVPGARAVLDATQMGFTVARCWPPTRHSASSVDPRLEIALVLADVLDCLKGTFARCAAEPPAFSPACRGFIHSGIRSNRQTRATPYADGEVEWSVAGWEFALTVA